MLTTSTIFSNPNPLRERTPGELKEDVRKFHRDHKLGPVVDLEVLIKGALIAQDATNIETCDLTAPEKLAIQSEAQSGFFQQTKELKVTILTTACAAVIQGWQQSTINASSRGWQCLLLLKSEKTDATVSLREMYITCLIDAAPWISGSIIGTWLSDPLQESRFGRRPALFISALFCAASVLGTARCTNWGEILACRLILGIGIGAKASIAPVFAAEAAADHLRGRLLMMWQLFDSFGISVGFACYWIVGRSWRGLLGSAAVPALILLVLVFLCPESPRFLIRKGAYADAFSSLRQLRGSDIQAARDLYYIHSQLQIETELFEGKRPEQWWRTDLYQQKVKTQTFFQRVGALFTVPRNRRACVAAFLVMASQQLCGINVLSFYSSALFRYVASNPGDGNSHSRRASDVADIVDCRDPMDDTVAWLNFGFGLANFLFTIPAYKFIDWRGRRVLLLISLGGMFFTLLATSGFFRIIRPQEAQKGLVAGFTVVIFTFFYGIGAGPVPFTFSAEVFPLAFREVGMSFSVMVNFLGMSLLILFVPRLTTIFSPNDPNARIARLFGESNLLFLFRYDPLLSAMINRNVLTNLHSGLNALAFVLVFFLVPSGTAQISLEEMNSIWRFAPRNRLARIWTPNVLEEFAFHESLHLPSSSFVEDIRRDFLQTISILIYVNWDDWSHFNEVFFSHRGADRKLDRTDRHIPKYDLQSLTSDNFLGPGAGSRFYDNRYIFCPIDIVKGSYLEREDGWRLPFLAGRSEACGSGGFGKVTKEVIAARHYQSGEILHSTEKSIARKLFKSKPDYERELFNLRALRACDNQNERIVLPLATVIIGSQFNILFPLAEMDLDKFLSGALLPPTKCDMSELLEELMSLAGALAHLHTGLGYNIHGCHTDLKPANILVYMKHDTSRRPQIGKWMITDFGLSIISRVERRGSGDGLPMESVTETMTQLQRMRGRGTYQAPEVCLGLGISRSSDIWSFGCILVRVLAFKLDGVQGLQRLDELRRKDDDGITDYAGRHDYFNRGDPAVLNPHIANWIRDLPKHHLNYSDEFLNGCANMLLRTLSISKNDRPEATVVQQLLGELRSVLHTSLHTPLQPISSMDSNSEYPSTGPPSSRSPSSSVSDPTSLYSLGLAVLTNALVVAIENCDLAGVERCLSQNVDIEKPDSKGNIPLGIAARLGNAPVVRRLLEANARVDARSAEGETPLMIATRNGHKDISKLLLEQGADCRAYSDDGLTCLHYATWSAASAELIRLLIPSSQTSFQTVDVPMKGFNEEMPLMTLVKNFVDNDCWEDKFRALVGAGANVNQADKFGRSPLECAVRDGSLRAVELLVDHNAVMVDLSGIPQSPAIKVLLRNASTPHRSSVDSGRSRRSSLLRR
ncbi:hypothetical protein CNMCM5623_009078 [Aspergillus felis]|uniref:Uncharacterized protein n=1 Tax=Aspergillus felis TaxID=1287682 RepID=A0A8H6Q198_9EURO|nr:hypothetical protein CNMCM5623_009078 [Aspergillus felis]